MIATREPIFVQHLVEKDAGVITRKRATRPIGAVHAGRKSDDEEARVRRTKWRHGTTIVIRITFLNVVEKRREPRTIATLFVEYCVVNQWSQSSM